MAPVSVAAGWNLISARFDPVDPSAAALFPTALTGAFAFDSTGYHPADTLVRGRGYWMKFGYPGSVEIGGYARPADTVALFAGWNLVGGMSTPVAAGDVTTIPPGIVNSKYYDYRKGYAVADTLRPGRAYWVKVSENGGMVPE